MRRGIGVAGLQKAQRAREQFKATGEEVKQSNLVAMKEQLSTFKSNLEEFAHKYRSEIRSNPAFRAQFHTMCANIGVDPLSSNKGMWNELLGFGDFYYELGVQVVEACWATRSVNGGMLELRALLRYVNKRRGATADPISDDDVIRAIKKLKVLGSGFDILQIGRTSYVRSVPGELNLDKNGVLELAQVSGFVSAQTVAAQPGWHKARVDAVLEALLREGLAMVDDGDLSGTRLYWFPCLSQQ